MKLQRKYVILIIAISAILSIPLYQKIKVIRATSLIKQAKVALESKDCVKAIEKTRAAFHLNSKNKGILPLLAQITVEGNYAPGFSIYDSIFNSASQSSEDTERYIEICQQLSLHEKAFKAFGNLKSKDQTPRIYELIIQICKDRRELERLKAYIEQAYERYPQVESIQFQYALYLIYLDANKDSTTAQSLLWKLIHASQAHIRLSAVLNLTNHFLLNDFQKLQLKKIVLEEPEPKALQDQLFKYELEMRLLPSKKNECIQKIIDNFNTYEGKNLLDAARWLRQHNKNAFLVEVLPQKNVFRNQQLLLVYLDALAILGAWEQVDSLLCDQNIDLDPLLKRLFKIRTALVLQKTDMMAIEWKALLVETSKNAEALLKIGNYFENLTLWDYAIEAYEAALIYGNYNSIVVEKLIQISSLNNSIAKVSQSLKKLIQKSPNNDNLKNYILYLQLLLNEATESTYKEALLLSEKYPENIAFKTTLALAYLKQGRSLKALMLYPSSLKEWKETKPNWNAVFMAVLQANHKETEAGLLMLKTNIAVLSREEKELIKEIL
jgi:hypothetical protein